MTELKPCPFCGAKPEHKYDGICCRIKCPWCSQSQVFSDWYGGDLGTTEASWNTRATDEIIKRLVGALKTYAYRDFYLNMTEADVDLAREALATVPKEYL